MLASLASSMAETILGRGERLIGTGRLLEGASNTNFVLQGGRLLDTRRYLRVVVY